MHRACCVLRRFREQLFRSVRSHVYMNRNKLEWPSCSVRSADKHKFSLPLFFYLTRPPWHISVCMSENTNVLLNTSPLRGASRRAHSHNEAIGVFFKYCFQNIINPSVARRVLQRCTIRVEWGRADVHPHSRTPLSLHRSHREQSICLIIDVWNKWIFRALFC